MKSAKYYIYKNLRTKGFSVRYRGRVIARPNTFIAEDVEFRVSEAGRQKVIKDRQKNVHAFVVADKYIVKKYPIFDGAPLDRQGKIRYNPYSAAYFKCDGRRINKAKKVVFQNGLCYLDE